MATTTSVATTNLKLAAALASVGVPLVDPGISKIRGRHDGERVSTQVTFHFGTSTVDGRDETAKLIRCWNYPTDAITEREILMGQLRAAMDNRDKLLVAIKDPDLRDALDVENQLSTLARRITSLVMVKKGNGFILVPENAPEPFVRTMLNKI